MEIDGRNYIVTDVNIVNGKLMLTVKCIQSNEERVIEADFPLMEE